MGCVCRGWGGGVWLMCGWRRWRGRVLRGAGLWVRMGIGVRFGGWGRGGWGRILISRGGGVVLVGGEVAGVSGSWVGGIRGGSHLSGGIVMVRSIAGGPASRNVVSGNVVTGNAPADVASRDGGVGNQFSGN